jgi:hypothetical protein
MYNEGCPAFQIFLRNLKPFFGLSRFTCVIYTLPPAGFAKARPHFWFPQEFIGATPCNHVTKNTHTGAVIWRGSRAFSGLVQTAREQPGI